MVLVLGISRVVSTLDPFLVSLSEFGLNSFSYVPHSRTENSACEVMINFVDNDGGFIRSFEDVLETILGDFQVRTYLRE